MTPQGAVGSNPTLSATLESPLGYDIYPLYWTTSKGGILMRYSYEFKRKAIELFYQGLREVAIVAGINSGQLYQWVHKYKTLGYNGLMNKPKGRIKILQ